MPCSRGIVAADRGPTINIRRFCASIQPGDGNLMECFYKARQNMSPACQKAVVDAGYEATIDSSAATTQVALSSNELINSPRASSRPGRTSAPRDCGRWRFKA